MSIPFADFEDKSDLQVTATPKANKVTAKDINQLRDAANTALAALNDWALGQLYTREEFSVYIANSADYFELEPAGQAFTGNEGFDSEAGNGLTYTGSPRFFRISSIATLEGPSNRTLRSAILKNGVPIENSIREFRTGQGGSAFGTISAGVTELVEGDRITVALRAPARADFSVDVLSFSLGAFVASQPIMEVPEL